MPFCTCCAAATKRSESRPALTDEERFRESYPDMFVCFDRDLLELGELDRVEFMVVGSYSRHFDARVHHWPVRGWTVSARWNPKLKRWERSKNWPTADEIRNLREREAAKAACAGEVHL